MHATRELNERMAAGAAIASRHHFIATTPFQFLVSNLIGGSLGVPYATYVATSLPESLHQIRRVARLLGVSVHDRQRALTPQSGRARAIFEDWRKAARFLSLKARLGRDDVVYIAPNTFPTTRTLWFSRGRYHLTFFDDGTGTIPFLRRRAQGDLAVQFPPISVRHAYNYLHPRRAVLPRIEFLTIYPGLAGASSDTVKHVDAALPIEHGHHRNVVDEIWFAGGPLVEAGILNALEYREVLDALQSACRRHRLSVRYFPHRMERNPDDYAGSLSKGETTLPFEIHLAGLPVRPRGVVSVSSSAVFHLKLLADGLCPVALIDARPRGNFQRIQSLFSYASDVLGIPVFPSDRSGELLSALDG